MFEQGYQEGRWGIRPTFLSYKPVSWAKGYAAGRRRRRMAAALELAMVAMVISGLSVAAMVLAAEAMAARLPV